MGVLPWQAIVAKWTGRIRRIYEKSMRYLWKRI